MTREKLILAMGLSSIAEIKGLYRTSRQKALLAFLFTRSYEPRVILERKFLMACHSSVSGS